MIYKVKKLNYEQTVNQSDKFLKSNDVIFVRSSGLMTSEGIISRLVGSRHAQFYWKFYEINLLPKI